MTNSKHFCAVVLALMVVAVPSWARAEVSPEAAEVLERYVGALGGREALDAVQSVHGMGQITAFGLQGTIKTWTVKPNRRATSMEIGPFTLLQGDDGTRAWRTDPSGKLIVLDGQDLEGARSTTWFDNKRWLDPDGGGGSIAMAPEEEQSKSYAVLDITSPSGEVRRSWFEKTTFLLVQTRVQNGGRTAINNFSDYAEYGGLKWPTVAKTTVMGQEANNAVVRFDSLAINIDVPDAQFAPPGEELEGVRYLEKDGEATFAFDYSTRHIWLKVSINGNPPADFIYDTGASITVLDSTYAASIGIQTQGQMTGQGAGGAGAASLAEVQSLRVHGRGGDGVEMGSLEIAVLSVNPALQPFFWRPCAGVLGFNFINRFVSEIDYATKTLVLRDPGSYTYSGTGTPIAMTLAGSTPAVRMSIDGTYEGEFRVDVGSSATVDLHSPFVAEHDLLKKSGRTVKITSGGFGGGFTSHVTRMQRIDLGPFSWEKPIVSLSGATRGALADPDYAGNIGNRILERFKCTFDYERRVLYLEPAARFDDEDDFTMTGLQIAKYGDRFQVVQVIDGSPAHEAGIRIGDVVQSVDGQPMSEYQRAEISELFERGKTGQKVAFTVAREGGNEDLTVTLRRVI